MWFVTGDLLRAERKAPGSEYGELIEHHITNGTIVPVAITCSLLQRAMKESGKSNFLIDGFPRNKVRAFLNSSHDELLSS